MSYCWKCGVELEAGARHCVLCRAALPREAWASASAVAPAYPAPTSMPETGRLRRRLLALAVLAGLAWAAFLVVLATDLLAHAAITWSRYALPAVVCAWIYMTLAILLLRRPWIMILAGYLPTLGLLALLDLANRRLDWFLGLGLPTASIVTGVLLLAATLWPFLHQRLSIYLAACLAACLVAGIGMDLLITGSLGAARMTWSFILLAAGLPGVVLLLLYGLVLRRALHAERYFHT